MGDSTPIQYPNGRDSAIYQTSSKCLLIAGMYNNGISGQPFFRTDLLREIESMFQCISFICGYPRSRVGFRYDQYEDSSNQVQIGTVLFLPLVLSFDTGAEHDFLHVVLVDAYGCVSENYLRGTLTASGNSLDDRVSESFQSRVSRVHHLPGPLGPPRRHFQTTGQRYQDRLYRSRRSRGSSGVVGDDSRDLYACQICCCRDSLYVCIIHSAAFRLDAFCSFRKKRLYFADYAAMVDSTCRASK